MDIKPTRMGLLQTKKRLSLADKGYDLLKQKYDALMMKFFTQMKTVKQLRVELSYPMQQASSSLFLAEAIQGITPVEQELKLNTRTLELDVRTDKVFGVEHPSLIQKQQQEESERSVSRTSNAQIDTVQKLMGEARPKLLQLINEQLALVMIAKEIARTKKKVNSLEKRVIPSLQDTKERISFVLEEQERELFTTLKLVKERRKRDAQAENE
ncbi:MAG: V-type ATP synthase subunit D [Nanobdellota archaeon]